MLAMIPAMLPYTPPLLAAHPALPPSHPYPVNSVVAYLGEGKQRILWKLLVGRIPLAGWTWPKYPNGTGASTPTVGCGTPGVNGTGCLYNLDADPTEHTNLGGSTAYSAIATELFAMLQRHNGTTFSPNRGEVDPKACAAAAGTAATKEDGLRLRLPKRPTGPANESSEDTTRQRLRACYQV